jgi:thymidylate kinase
MNNIILHRLFSSRHDIFGWGSSRAHDAQFKVVCDRHVGGGLAWQFSCSGNSRVREHFAVEGKR